MKKRWIVILLLMFLYRNDIISLGEELHWQIFHNQKLHRWIMPPNLDQPYIPLKKDSK